MIMVEINKKAIAHKIKKEFPSMSESEWLKFANEELEKQRRDKISNTKANTMIKIIERLGKQEEQNDWNEGGPFDLFVW